MNYQLECISLPVVRLHSLPVFVVTCLKSHLVQHVLVYSISDIYIRVDFYINQHKMRHQKTPANPKSEITLFNQVIFFTVSEYAINQSTIITSVYEVSLAKVSTRQLLGRAYIGRETSKEGDHWLSMLQSLRQPVSEWHPLLI